MPLEFEVETVTEMPASAGSRDSKWDALLSSAINDKQPRKATFAAGTDKKEVQTFARNLSHAANVKGHGMTTSIVVADDGVVSLFWQIRDKRIVNKTNGAAKAAATKKASR